MVVGADKAGNHSTLFPLLGAAVCFAVRAAGLRLGGNLPSAPGAPRDTREQG